MAPIAFDPLPPTVSATSRPTVAELKQALKPAVLSATPSPKTREHTASTLESLAQLTACASNGTVLDGHSLTTAQVVGTARLGSKAEISKHPAVRATVEDSVAFLNAKLHTSIYGVNTGFGGSADTRTDAPSALQISLLEHQLSGILPSVDSPLDCHGACPLLLDVADHSVMPEQIVRAAMLVRVNSLVRGHSGVRIEVLETLLQLLNKRITPMVPLRGSISASGDLQPLSYVAACLCGHPDLRVIDRSAGSPPEILPAGEALRRHGITPVSLGPKEGLGLINGTAFSAAAACLAAHEAHVLALLSQALTAMTLEAMVGQAGNFHPFIHDVCRPHPGQVEAARNMRGLLEGSRLAVAKEEARAVADEMGDNVLRQDRYPLRTAPQWLGPQLEDLARVEEALAVEINSTTDNPLLDVDGDHTHHGGNFQATAVAQAMEKVRLALFMLGKLAFSQATELINPAMNKGLPSCLAGDEPSTNYHVKGLDINMAAYTAELGYLASPVSTHVQSAEQHNQAVNSMALVSARYALQGVEVLSMLLSAQLYCVCMAVDLRVMDVCFRRALADSIPALLEAHFAPSFTSREQVNLLAIAVVTSIYRTLERTVSADSGYRFADAFNAASSCVVDALAGSPAPPTLQTLAAWKLDGARAAAALYISTRDAVLASPAPSSAHVGAGTRPLYEFVRITLGVAPRRGDVRAGKGQFGTAIGSDVSTIHAAVRDGRIASVLATMF